MTLLYLRIALASAAVLCMKPSLAADQSLARQSALTRVKTLPNGAVFIQRDLPGSEISHLEVNVKFGQADLPEDVRATNALTFDVMSMATSKFSKDKIFNLTESLTIGLNCTGGIEQSGCQIETVTDHFDPALELLTSVMNQPSFNPEDVALGKQRRIAQFQQEEQNPEQHVNSLVNTIYYPAGHPYRLIPRDAIKQLEKLTRADLVSYHRSIQNARSLQIVYVGPKLSAARQQNIETAFASWKGSVLKPRNILPPVYDGKKNIAFEHRPIPTAYIRAKFNAPGALSKDSAVSRVLFEIISEILQEEVRTKRSLSYSIGSMTLQLEQGLGVIVASTSKPKETIETIADVLRTVSQTKFTAAKLAEYKNVFTTAHYLTLETHSSFAGALSTTHLHLGDPHKLYEFPLKIAAVTSEDIHRLAKAILKQMRVGIIYDKDKFEPEWLNPLLEL